MVLAAVPVVDISPYRHGNAAERRALADEIDRTCRDIGFMVIGGHGVDPGLIDAVEATSRAFFDLPLEEKMRIVRPAPDVTRGYQPFKAEILVKSRGGSAAGDLNESLMIGPVDVDDSAYYTSPAAGRHFATNLWPERPEGLRDAYERYYRVMDTLAIDLMRLFALGLELPEHYFDASVDRSISRLRVRNYPAPDGPPEPGQLRASAHSDYGSLTILKTEDRPGGLQVQGRDGEWLETCRTCPAPSSSISATCWRAGPTTAGSRPCTASSTRHPNAPPKAGGSRWCSSRIPTTTLWWRACRAAPTPTARLNIRRPRPAVICARSSSRRSRPFPMSIRAPSDQRLMNSAATTRKTISAVCWTAPRVSPV